jgi:hypothetical protein
MRDAVFQVTPTRASPEIKRASVKNVCRSEIRYSYYRVVGL